MERKTLTITEVLETRTVGKNNTPLYRFKAKDAGGTEVVYETWSKSVAELVKLGASIEVDADVEKKESNGNTYIHHIIKQAYVNGQPVAQQGKGGGFRTDPETQKWVAEFNRASIERQVAVKEIGECLRTDAKIVPAHLIAAYWETVEAMIGGTKPRQPPPPAPTVTVQTVPAASQPVSQEKAWDGMGKESEAARSLPRPSNTGELMALAKKHFGLSYTQVCKEAGVKQPGEIKDVGKVWDQITAVYPLAMPVS